MLNFYGSSDDGSVRRERKLLLFSLKFSAIKFLALKSCEKRDEKFYGYDDGFGSRIKQRFSAIIRRHLWQASSIIALASCLRVNMNRE